MSHQLLMCKQVLLFHPGETCEEVIRLRTSRAHTCPFPNRSLIQFHRRSNYCVAFVRTKLSVLQEEACVDRAVAE